MKLHPAASVTVPGSRSRSSGSAVLDAKGAKKNKASFAKEFKPLWTFAFLCVKKAISNVFTTSGKRYSSAWRYRRLTTGICLNSWS